MEKEYKFCPQCGNKVEKDAKFCDACGYNFETKESRSTESQNQSSTQGSQVGQFMNNLNKKVVIAAIGIAVVLVVGFYFLTGNFAIAGEYEALDWVGTESNTSFEISKKGVATIIENSEYDGSRYEVGLPLIYDKATETYILNTDKKVALSIAGPLADLGTDGMEEIDQIIALLGLEKEVEGENLVLSGEIDFSLLEIADIAGSLSFITDDFIIEDKGNDMITVAGETFIKVEE